MKLTTDQIEHINNRNQLSQLADTISDLQQNDLLNEAKFIDFAKSRGVQVNAAVKKYLTTFHDMKVLKSDFNPASGEIFFHPFRFHTLSKLLGFREAPTQWLTEHSVIWNAAIDLAILLEPIFWPQITGKFRYGVKREELIQEQLKEHRDEIFDLILKLDPNQWQKVHHSIKVDAENQDANSDLYLLLRVSSWEQRKKLTDSISAGLWFRHIAEILRLGFQKVHKVKWLEEDYTFGHWHKGDRTIAYGSERPTENIPLAKRYLAQSFGILSGTIVRWYVEGETEYHAIRELIPAPQLFNIELVNLKGNVKSDKQNIALKLKDHLEADVEQKIFSFITFDKDVAQNVKTIGKQISLGRVRGLVEAHSPDFEFANFKIEELVEIASELEKQDGYDPTNLLNADWSKVRDAKTFERKYIQLSESHTPLKGARWGQVDFPDFARHF